VDSDYSIATQEKFVVDFIQSLGLQKTDIGGWSMGGWIVLKLALDHPEMLDRVVVYDSAGLRHQVGGGAGVFHPKDEADIQLLAHLMEPEGKPLPHFIAKDALRTLQQKQAVTDRAMASMQTSNDFLDLRMVGMTEPLLIVWGREDQLIPLEVAQKMHQLAPRSELDVVEGCGHLAPKTCPGRVAAATADFLKAQPAPEGLTRTLTNMR
jgi:pimeloyl-ACP methyl ester carboxylesterase